jgi:signal transduction histidine kinase
MRVSLKSSTVQVFVNSNGPNDSIIHAMRPMAQHYSRTWQDGKSFIIKLAPDTIKIDTLNQVFGKALRDSKLPVRFQIVHTLVPPEEMSTFRMRTEHASGEHRELHSALYGDTIRLDAVRLNPLSRYSASVFDFKGYILKSISPQILFSLLLTVITIGAYVVLYKSLRSQQRLMELKNDFINNVTHELKTPVATVSVALEALKNFHALNDPTRTKEYLDIAQNELNRLTLMTDKILKASSFENSSIVIQKESVDLEKTADEILESMKLVFEKHQAHISFAKEGADFILEGSQTHLTNVIYNLLDNALKYSPGNAQVTITLKDQGDSLCFIIQDSGIGVPSEYKKKIFEKFFRVPTGDIHNIKGYGLGLSYVAGVVRAHKGNIDVESEPGKGSTFTIQLPKKHV